MASAPRRPGRGCGRPGRRSRRGSGVRCATTPAPPGTPAPASSQRRTASTARMCASRETAGRDAGIPQPGHGHPRTGQPAPAGAGTQGAGVGVAGVPPPGHNAAQPVPAHVQGGGSRSYGAPKCSAHSTRPVMSRPVSLTIPASDRRAGRAAWHHVYPVPIAAGPERSFSGSHRQFSATTFRRPVRSPRPGNGSGQPEYRQQAGRSRDIPRPDEERRAAIQPTCHA